MAGAQGRRGRADRDDRGGQGNHRENGLSARVRFIQANLHECEEELRKEPFDVAVSEMMGDLAVDETSSPLPEDPVTLAPGRSDPATLDTSAAPLALAEAEEPNEFGAGDRVSSWEDSPPRPHGGSPYTPHSYSLPGGAVVAPAARLASFDCAALPERNEFAGGADFTLARDGRVTGVGMWWRSMLAPGIELATGPDDPRRTGDGRSSAPRNDARRRGEIPFELRAAYSPKPQLWAWGLGGGDGPPTTFESMCLGQESKARMRGPTPRPPEAVGEIGRLGKLLIRLDGTRTFGEAVGRAPRRGGGPDPAWGEDPLEEARRLFARRGRLRGLRR